MLNALIEADRVQVLSGEPKSVRLPTDSGQPHDAYRCPQCQIALWSTYGGRTVTRFVRVGTLDDPSALKPGVHIFTRSKVAWVALPADVPAFAEYYETRTLWPAESLARRKALFAS